MALVVPTILAMHIGSAEPTLKVRIDRPQRVIMIEELVYSARSSSEFQPFMLERPLFRPLWKL